VTDTKSTTLSRVTQANRTVKVQIDFNITQTMTLQLFQPDIITECRLNIFTEIALYYKNSILELNIFVHNRHFGKTLHYMTINELL